MNKAMIIGGTALCAAIATLGFLGAPTDPPAAATPNLQQIAYFKSGQRARVFAFCTHESLTEEQVQAFTPTLAHTENQITVAAIYDCANGTSGPQDQLTLAPNATDAIGTISTAPFNNWQWRIWIAPDGTSQAVFQP